MEKISRPIPVQVPDPHFTEAMRQIQERLDVQEESDTAGIDLESELRLIVT